VLRLILAMEPLTAKRQGVAVQRVIQLLQRLPADQGTPKRKECLVDVGALVIPNAQAAKLTRPGKGATTRPTATGPSRCRSRCGAWPARARCVTSPETAPYGRRVVAAIPEHTVRPLPWSSLFAVQRRNRRHERQGLLRVVPVRAGQSIKRLRE
jgi:hypothetical protein